MKYSKNELGNAQLVKHHYGNTLYVIILWTECFLRLGAQNLLRLYVNYGTYNQYEWGVLRNFRKVLILMLQCDLVFHSWTS